MNDAFDAIQRTLERRSKKLLAVSERGSLHADWQRILDGKEVEILASGSGGEALAAVRQQYLDCLILDAQLTDIPVLQLVEEIQSETKPYLPAVIFWAPPEMGKLLVTQVRRLSGSHVRYADSPERLLEEAVSLLHIPESELSESQREILAALRRNDATLSGKKVLVVDDDVRNIFALTTVLEQHQMQVVHAENGRAGIEMLRQTPGIDAVLMDIMMPEMDGYQTMRAMRNIPEFRTIPIIAVTAKAMKGDRAKCIEAGASDHITKPVDLDQLFAVLRVWLAESEASALTAMTTSR